MGRWFFRFREEVVPPRLRDGFRLGPAVPPSSSSLGFCYFASPPPPRFVVSGIDICVRSIHDVDMIGGEQTRGCRREEGRAQEEPRRLRRRGGPRQQKQRRSRHAPQWISAGRVWGAASLLASRRLASVAERCACAVARCVGASLDRCAFVEVCSGPKTWRFALPLLTPRGLRRRSQASIDASCVQMTREPC